MLILARCLVDVGFACVSVGAENSRTSVLGFKLHYQVSVNRLNTNCEYIEIFYDYNIQL